MCFVAVCVSTSVSNPIEVAGMDSVAVANVSGTVEEGTSCSDEATDEDRR